jgi:hypothetical protein
LLTSLYSSIYLSGNYLLEDGDDFDSEDEELFSGEEESEDVSDEEGVPGLGSAGKSSTSFSTTRDQHLFSPS